MRGRDHVRLSADYLGTRRAAGARRGVVTGPGQGVRGLQVTGGEGVHRVTASASAAARLSRLRGIPSAMSAGHDDDQADGDALLR
jgi:hypothetical protein